MMSVAFSPVTVNDAQVLEEEFGVTCNGLWTVTLSAPPIVVAQSQIGDFEAEISQFGVGSMAVQTPGTNDFEVLVGNPFEICVRVKDNAIPIIATVDYEFCDEVGTVTWIFPPNPGAGAEQCITLEANQCN